MFGPILVWTSHSTINLLCIQVVMFFFFPSTCLFFLCILVSCGINQQFIYKYFSQNIVLLVTQSFFKYTYWISCIITYDFDPILKTSWSISVASHFLQWRLGFEFCQRCSKKSVGKGRRGLSFYQAKVYHEIGLCLAIFLCII